MGAFTTSFGKNELGPGRKRPTLSLLLQNAHEDRLATQHFISVMLSTFSTVGVNSPRPFEVFFHFDVNAPPCSPTTVSPPPCVHDYHSVLTSCAYDAIDCDVASVDVENSSPNRRSPTRCPSKVLSWRMRMMTYAKHRDDVCETPKGRTTAQHTLAWCNAQTVSSNVNNFR